MFRAPHSPLELVGAALDRDGAHRVPRQLAHGQQRRDVAHALVHDGTQLRQLPERPVAMQHEAKRARVCQVQERQQIVPRRLQCVRKAAECAPGQLPLVGNRVFITNVKGTFLGMSESEEASKRR